jgi:hypothetical protein
MVGRKTVKRKVATRFRPFFKLQPTHSQSWALWVPGMESRGSKNREFQEGQTNGKSTLSHSHRVSQIWLQMDGQSSSSFYTYTSFGWGRLLCLCRMMPCAALSASEALFEVDCRGTPHLLRYDDGVLSTQLCVLPVDANE